MNRRLLLSALAVIAAPMGAYGAGRLEAMQPWSRPAVAGTNGVGYLVVANHGPADVLEKIETPVAARVEMHSSSMANGVMTMKKVDRIAVPAGGQVAFAPGGFHLMLIGLTRTLKAGDRAPATLTFASGRKIETAFLVSDGMGPPRMSGTTH